MTSVDAALLEERSPSVGAMLTLQVEKSADREAFRHRGDDGRWVSLTWKQTEQVTHEFAAGLLALGLQRGDRVAIASNTRIEWILADLGIMCAGGATTTVYPSTKDADVAYILTDSGSRVVVAEDNEQAAKVLAHTDELDLLAIVLMEGNSDHELVMTFDDLRTRGVELLRENPHLVTDAIDATGPDDLSTLIYTSGTTGRPKGVTLTHDAWAYEGRAIELFDLLHPDDLQFLWLPLSHVFGKALVAIQLQIGFATAVDGVIERIVDGLGEVKPTFMCGAPRIYEKVRNKVMLSTSGAKGRIAAWAFHIGNQTVPYRLQKRPLPRKLAAQYAIADRLVFSKLKARMGGRIRFFVSGSAKLNAQVQQWFYAAGLLIIEGYGLTETSAVSCLNLPDDPRLGTVGPTIPGTRLQIAEDGEILLQGPGVSRGYHQLPEQSAEAFTDGWFHTGDIGEIDSDGYLRITDRKKDLIKTSGGKYVAPQKVEGALVANCPYVSQVIVHGEGRKYITALLCLDKEGVETWGAAHGVSGDVEAIAADSRFKADLDANVAKGNKQLERWETVKRYATLTSEFSVDQGEVTPSMKIRRSTVEKRYADVLDGLYDKED